MSGGPGFVAETYVAAPPAAVFGFLADLENHWRLTGPWVRILRLEGPPGARVGGAVRIGPPLALGRTARTAVVAADAPHSMAGRARIGRRTEAAVRWSIEPSGAGSWVRLEASLLRAGPVDRLLLALGGAAVMRAIFRRTTTCLAEADALRRADGRPGSGAGCPPSYPPRSEAATAGSPRSRRSPAAASRPGP